MKIIEKLEEISIKTELCCHCGACAGLCPTKAILCNNNILTLKPKNCVNCGLCINCCPAIGYELSDLTLEDIKELPTYSTSSVNENIYNAASSGGFVTQALLTLLSIGEITAAAVVVTGNSLEESCSKYVITNDANKILQARRSKYTQASLDNVIEHIKNNDGKYAIVALPCQLYSISKAIKRLPVLKERIVYRFGMVCGYTYSEDCIDGLLGIIGVNRNQTERILGWRENGLPGNFEVKLKDGNTKHLPFVDEHSLDVTLYAQNRCKLCKDCLCENADVVTADIGGWKQKRTLVIVRTLCGEKLLRKLSNSGEMIVENCPIPFEKTVLPFMLREKRAKTNLRIISKQKKGLPIPEWNRVYIPKLLLSQKIEALLSFRLENKALKNIKKYSSKKLLNISHWAYHKISSLFILKVIYKLQVYFEKTIITINHIFKSAIQKLKSLLGKKVRKTALNAVVIGLGKWGAQYLNFLMESKHYNLVAAYDSDKEKLSHFAKKYHFLAANSVKQLCENYNADVIFILTPTTTHEQIFNEVCCYGLPIYMEKPIAAQTDSANRIKELSNQYNSLLYVAHSMKYEPCIQKIKDLLSQNGLGAIQSVELSRVVKNKNDFFYDNAALYQIGVHLIDLLLFLLDKVDNISNLKIYSSNINKKCSLCFNNNHNQKIMLHYGFDDVYNFTIKIKGNNGSILFADSLLTLNINGVQKNYHIEMIHEKTIFVQLKEFYNAVAKKQPYLNSIDNAIKIMSFCDDIINCGEISND